MTLEDYWREWLKDVQRSLAEHLAHTIGIIPSENEDVRRIVEQLIALEQELS